MKKVLFLFFVGLLGSISGVCQTQTLFVDKSIASVFEEAKKDKKPIVVMVYANWCAHCNKMKKETFTEKEVVDFYTSQFHCVAIDGESASGIEFKQKYQSKFRVKSFPTFVFFDSDETLLGCNSGEFNKEQFINEARFVLNPENQFNTIKKAFNQDVSNGDNCLKYVTLIKRAGFDPTLVTQKYLNTKTEAELLSEYNWKVIANGINDIEAKEIAFVVAKKEEYIKVTSAARVERKLLFVAQDNLQPLVARMDTVNYAKKRSIAETFKIRKVDSLLYRFDLNLAEKTQNWKKYAAIASQSTEKMAYKDSNLLVEIATVYFKHMVEKKEIDDAINWIKQALQLGESSEKYKLTAQLYWKQKEKNKAIEYAEKGKNFVTQNGWKTDDFDALLQQYKKNNP